MRRLLACLLVLVGLSGQVLAQVKVRPYDDIIESGVLKVAVYDNFPPYSELRDGTPSGVDVQLAGRLAQALGLKLELLWVVPGEKLDDDLRNFIWKGHYLRPDVIADVMLRVPYNRDYSNRRNELGELVNELAVMMAPYQRERWQVAYDQRRLKEVPSIAVFAYHPIGVELDSVPSFYMTSVFGGRLSGKTQHFVSPREAFSAMRAGQVDAVMAMRGEIDGLLHEAADDQLALGKNAYPELGQQAWDIGIAVHESNRQLGYAIEETLDGMIRSGAMQQLYEEAGLQYELPGLYQDVE